MSELSELDEINRLDNQREELKREADAKYYDHGDIRDEIVVLFNQYRRLNYTNEPYYLILDRKSYEEVLKVCDKQALISSSNLHHYMGMVICIVQQSEDRHYVQVA